MEAEEKMSNLFRELETIIKNRQIDRDNLVHALMATVYTSCCDHCADTLHSEEFMQAFDHMAEEFMVCSKLGNRLK